MNIRQIKKYFEKNVEMNKKNLIIVAVILSIVLIAAIIAIIIGLVKLNVFLDEKGFKVSVEKPKEERIVPKEEKEEKVEEQKTKENNNQKINPENVQPKTEGNEKTSKIEKAQNKTANEIDQQRKIVKYQNGERISATVTKVIDGDTIKVKIDDEKYTVRMIGVDTPESVHPNKVKNTPFGKIASEYTKTRLLDKQVELQKDISGTDKYGRLLSYVYIDSKMFNEELVENGYAKMATFPPDVNNVEKFKKLQEKAKKENKGVWSNQYNK